MGNDGGGSFPAPATPQEIAVKEQLIEEIRIAESENRVFDRSVMRSTLGTWFNDAKSRLQNSVDVDTGQTLATDEEREALRSFYEWRVVTSELFGDATLVVDSGDFIEAVFAVQNLQDRVNFRFQTRCATESIDDLLLLIDQTSIGGVFGLGVSSDSLLQCIGADFMSVLL